MTTCGMHNYGRNDTPEWYAESAIFAAATVLPFTDDLCDCPKQDIYMSYKFLR